MASLPTTPSHPNNGTGGSSSAPSPSSTVPSSSSGTASSNATASSTTAGTSSSSNTATAETYGALDVRAVSTQMWMGRIPHKLAEAWENAPEGTVLGELTFTKGSPPTTTIGKNGGISAKSRSTGPPPGGKKIKQSLTVSVSSTFTSTHKDLPLEYTLESMTKKVPTLHPFTRNRNGSVTLHGTVGRACNLQTQLNNRYRQFSRNRLVSSVTNDRFVRPVEASELSVRTKVSARGGGGGGARGGGVGTSDGFGDNVARFGKRMIEASEFRGNENTRKRKFDGQTTRSVVFELFATQRFWTVKELRNTSGRLEKELRTVLNEIGEFHRSGEHKNTWELRKEFQKGDGA